MSDLISHLQESIRDRYVIQRKLAQGGSSMVYLAQDVRHDRPVALKVLEPELLSRDTQRLFLDEIRTTANLQHPHILPLFDSGEASGLLFYVMPYVEGESLRERLRREGRLPLDEGVALISEIGSAIEYAHRMGVLHRDIKPENILLSEGGPMVGDFGIALALEEATGPGSGHAAGTLGYASPEQLTGEAELDERSDLYSLACVLHEILTGDQPHGSSTPPGLVARILTMPAKPVRVRRPDLPQEIDDALRRALATDRQDRFDSVTEFVNEIRATAETSSVAPSFPRLPVDEDAPRPTRVLVLPIENLSEDAARDYFCTGLAEEIMSHLASTDRLHVVPPDSARTVSTEAAGLRGVARDLGVTYVLQGQARFENDRYSVEFTLMEGATLQALLNRVFNGGIGTEDVLRIQEHLASAVLQSLPEPLHPPDGLRYQPDPRAYDLYLRARDAWFTRRLPALHQAIESLKQAIERDAFYARAYAALADVYNVLGGIDYSTRPPIEVYPKAGEAAKRAVALDPDLGEAHAALGNYLMSYVWDWQAAARHLKRAVELNPAYSTGRQWYSNYLQYVGQADDGIAQAMRALEDDPRSVFLRSSLARHYLFTRQPDKAVSMFKWTLELDPGFLGAHVGLAMAEFQAGRPDSALVILEEIRSERARSLPLVVALRAYLLGILHRRSEARRLSDTLRADRRGYVPPELICLAHIGLDEIEQALDHLEKALAARSQVMSQVKVEPLFDRLRGHPRFEKIRGAVGL